MLFSEAPKPWGIVIGACALVVFCTFLGVLCMVPFMRKLIKKYPATFSTILNSFAAGALLSCAFYLILFEATHYIAAGGQGEATHASTVARARKRGKEPPFQPFSQASYASNENGRPRNDATMSAASREPLASSTCSL